MSSKKPSLRKGGFSRAEKAAFPIIILIIAWIAYSVMQPAANIHTQATASTTIMPGGSYAPDFTLPTVSPSGLTGQSISLSSYRGQVVVLEFMEPWCPHCQSMAPILEQLHQKYSSVAFLSVAGPWNGATANDVARFENQYGTSWVYMYDSSGTIMNTYGVNGTPTFFIINSKGSIVDSLQGAQTYAELENIILQLIGT